MGQATFFTSFLAGVASFLSPCVLPLVPGYISFISGLSLEELSKGVDRTVVMKRAGLGSIFFVIGFSIVFTLLGASASVAGKFLQSHAFVFSKVAGVVIILFGLHTAGILPIPWLYYEKRIQAGVFSPGFIGAFLMGFAFAFGWTPCIGPILTGILILASTQKTLYEGTLLLFVYSLGLGIPFILTGFGVNAFLRFFARYKRFIRAGEVFAGVLLVSVGVLVFTNRLTMLIGILPQSLRKFAL
jgi:cytochrome c-type biogenesis protein